MDKAQAQVLRIMGGHHLVLAPPGCGKTHILAGKIEEALKMGVSPENMLCLTFTNRAARAMKMRIDDRIGQDASASIFIGNIHKFCASLLFKSNVVSYNSIY